MSTPRKLPKVIWNTIAGRPFPPEVLNNVSQARPASDQSLSAEFSEEDGRYVLKVDVPGVEKERVQVSFDDENRLLTVTAENTEVLKEDEKCLWSDIAHGFKSRSFSVPLQVDVEQITATHDNGVLELSLPKKENKKRLRIIIK